MAIREIDQMSARLFEESRLIRFSMGAFLLVVLGTVVLSGCSPASPAPAEVVSYVAKKAPLPPGVTAFCWEEPIVTPEQNGPGLDADEHWYHPSHTAIRQVRGGKWRPCSPVKSEVEKGSYK